jgi:hypothetical protein
MRRHRNGALRADPDSESIRRLAGKALAVAALMGPGSRVRFVGFPSGVTGGLTVGRVYTVADVHESTNRCRWCKTREMLTLMEKDATEDIDLRAGTDLLWGWSPCGFRPADDGNPVDAIMRKFNEQQPKELERA